MRSSIDANNDGIFEESELVRGRRNPTPTIKSLDVNLDNSIHLTVEGLPGQRYALQHSADLMQWHDGMEKENIAGEVDFIEEVDRSSGHYLRIRVAE